MQTGYIVLADIAGFPDNLTPAERDHARNNTKILLSIVLEAIEVPLRFAALPAAAVLLHADADKVVSSYNLLERIEGLHTAFAGARDELVRKSACSCAACRALGSLHLTVLLHHGDYDMADRETREEIGKTARSLLQCLTDDLARQDGDAGACCLLTREAVDALNLTGYFAQSPRHVANDDRFGEIDYTVHDLEAVRQARAQEAEDDCWTGRPLWCRKVIADLPAPPAAVWPYLSDPEQRKRWVNGLSEVELENADHGRVVVGTTLHCTHGRHVFPFAVAQWQPGKRLIYGLPMPLDTSVTWAQVLEPRKNGSRLTMTYTRPSAPTVVRSMLMRAITRKMGKAMYANTSASAQKLERLIEDEVDAGHIDTRPPPAVEVAAIDAALAERFPLSAD
jgi:uncharacterized protein YndB with AHSA1/START domain